MYTLLYCLIFRYTCNNCVVMDSVAECVCCQSIDVIKATCQEVAAAGLGPMSTCIIQHPAFSSDVRMPWVSQWALPGWLTKITPMTPCLNVWVLQAVYNEYKQRYGHTEKSLFELVLSWLLIIAVKHDVIELFSYYLTRSMLSEWVSEWVVS